MFGQEIHVNVGPIYTGVRAVNWVWSRLFQVVYIGIWCLQCFDAVGWAAGRASGL